MLCNLCHTGFFTTTDATVFLMKRVISSKESINIVGSKDLPQPFESALSKRNKSHKIHMKGCCFHLIFGHSENKSYYFLIVIELDQGKLQTLKSRNLSLINSI